MSKKFVFVCAEHQEYGSTGWRLKSQPDFDPLSGMGVAHDCLEHFSDSAEPHDEFMALGAMMFIRNTAYFHRHGKDETNPGVDAAADLPEILRHVVYEGYRLKTAPATCPGNDDLEGYIEKMFSQYIKDLDDDEALKITAEDRRNITSWLRIGYRKAYKRYQGRDGEAESLFCEIEEKADKYLKYAEPYGTDELHVTVDFSRLTARVAFKQNYGEDY